MAKSDGKWALDLYDANTMTAWANITMQKTKKILTKWEKNYSYLIKIYRGKLTKK